MKYKLFIIIFLFILLGIFVFIDMFGLSFSLKSVDDIKKEKKLKDDLLSELKINGVNAIYDKVNNVFYYNILNKYEGNMYILNLNLKKFKYRFKKNKTNIIKVNYDEPIDVIIYNDKYYYETKIIITNLPLISINTADEITKLDTKGEFLYTNNSSKQKYFNSNIKIHTRGASSASFDKKSYRINFYDSKYENNKNVAIKDFYYGDSFILMSVYRDPSKIRDKLAEQLWNDMSNDFKSEKLNSKFVELFVNNEYKGLYVFTEPVNRKKLNLDKQTSLIIKSNSWQELNKNVDFSKLKEQSYLGYSIKYPNDKNQYNKVWSAFFNKISNYYNSNITNDYKVINNTFNINNYIDIIIFNSFTNNIDSDMVKNLYFYMKDYNGLVYIEPWDLEFTFGYIYDYSYNNCGKTIDDFDNIAIPLFSNDKKINDLIIKRYNFLRKNILTPEYFDEKLDEYLKELKYVSKRDSKIWYDYDIEEEIDRVRYWIHNRFSVMDSEVEKWNIEKK